MGAPIAEADIANSDSNDKSLSTHEDVDKDYVDPKEERAFVSVLNVWNCSVSVLITSGMALGHMVSYHRVPGIHVQVYRSN